MTRPVLSTATSVGSLERHVAVRLGIAIPLPSYGVAVSCNVVPSCSCALGGVTLTNATGTSSTVSVALPVLPLVVADTSTTPGARATTRPVESTVAMAGVAELQAIVRPAVVSGRPSESASCNARLSP